MKTRRPIPHRAFVLLSLLLLLLASCKPLQLTHPKSSSATELLEPQVLTAWPTRPMRVGLVFTEPLSLRELAARTPGRVEGVFFAIGTLQGAFRSPEPVSAETAASRVRDYARFYLTRQKDLDLRQIQRLLDRYEVSRYTEREARALFRRSPEAQAYARTLVERSLNRRYARAVLEEGSAVVYALEVLAEPPSLWGVWGSRLQGVQAYSSDRRFYPPKPESVLRSINAVRNWVDQNDLDRLFDEGVRILREEYGIQHLFAEEVQP